MQGIDRDVRTAADLLRAGRLVALPTETVYGLGADAENRAAVARIFQAKQRPASHPLIVHIAEPSQLGEWVDDVPDVARDLAAAFWPGPLTMIFPRGRRVPAETAGGGPTVAIRVPSHPVMHAVLKAFGGGVAAPSANRFGSVSPTTADHVRSDLGDAVDFILDGGPCSVGVESTIVQVVDGSPSILRPGGVSREAIAQVVGGDVGVDQASPIRVPGQHPSHYAPSARVVITGTGELIDVATAAQQRGHRVGVLLPAALRDAPIDAHAVIAIPESLEEYARRLYSIFRELDQRGCDLIVASLPEPNDLGLAIANRLSRAAGPR